ncbi:chitotriosidase-1-like isoform X2 [Biomphalaria glabrata]|uniref:Chitotriosidase-1-like isoform X2 n=1 Tax=Biomphalaria glabrata TaxID=6526 RepID=A0A9W3BCL4_BIOGL|nr:chitotriosidase-1-like isoform X2 [Biomphalaria glabrata]
MNLSLKLLKMKIAYLAVQLYFLFACEAAPCNVFLCNVNAAALAQSRLKLNLLDPEICQTVIIEYASSQNNRLLHHYAVTQFIPDLRASRQNFKNFKCLIEVYTSELIGDNFYTMYLIPESRALFIQSCIDYLRRYDMNGISIRHSFHRKPFFKKYFPILLQDIMDAFQKESERTGRTRLLLLADIVIVDTKYYSFFPLIGNWTHRHQSRLYGNTTDDELNMNYTVNYYLSKGAVKSKLVICVAFSGNVYYNFFFKNEFNKRYHTIMRMDYDLICKKLIDYQRLKGRKFRYPDNCPFYFYDNDRYLVYYDDAISLISKVRYAKEMGLAGVNIWDVSDDDMAGECGDGPFPLLHHVSQECRKP